MTFLPALLQQLLPTQETRLLQLHTVLGQDALIAETLEVCAAMGPPAQSMPAPWQTQADAPVITPTNALGHLDQTRPGEPAEGWASQRLLIVALSTDAHLSLKRLLGQAVQIDLRTQDGSFVRWGGSITGAETLGSDGALARYRLQVEPWLAFAAYRQDSRIFQNQSVPQIVDAILGSYQGQGALQVQWRWDLQEESAYSQRSLCTQYRESDLAFIHRLLREEGIFYWWEQTPAQEQPTLVLADHNGAIPTNHRARVRYSQTAAVMREDSLLRYSASAQLHSSNLQQASLDYRSLQQRLQRQDAATPSSTQASALTLAVVDQPGQYLWPDQTQGERLSQRQIQSLNGWAAQSAAAGSWRDAVAGSSFTLTDHPIHTGLDEERDRFLILRTHQYTRNNLHADALADIERQLGPAPQSVLSLPNPQQHAELAPPEAAADSALQHSAIDSAAQPLRNSQQALHWARLILQPASLPLRPEPLRDAAGQPDIRLHGKPTAPGVQTALVVGLGQDPIHSEREGRIQIQFHWQRGSQSSPRQGSPAHHDSDNAPGNASVGTWVRVLQTQAGSNWGSHYTPRLGQEVLVGYLHNDIDRPVVIGSLYNGQGQSEHASNQIAQGAAGSTGNAPAWFPGGSTGSASAQTTATEQTQTQTQTQTQQWQNHRHDAILAGYKSQELASSHSGNGGYNQLLIDSSAGQGRLELASSPDAAGRQATRLQLGHLLQQTDNRRQQSRGHGLDLYTPHWGAVRAGSGLLISSQAEPASHQSGQQLQSEQAQQELAQSQQLLQTLAAHAQKHQAQATADEPAIRYPQAGQQSPTNQDSTEPNTAERLPADADLQALRHSLAHTRSSQEAETAEISASNAPQAIGGGHGTISAWSSPEILFASPAGIHSASSGQSHFSSGGSYSATARQHINQMASAQYSLSSAQGIVLYTVGKGAKGQQPVQEEGIRLHAATGTVVVQAQNNRLEATAKHQVAVDSTHGSVSSGARGHQLLVAAGSAIEIKDGNITLLSRGNVTFKASQKVLTGPLAVQLPPLGFPSASCLPCLFKALESGSALAKVS